MLKKIVQFLKKPIVRRIAAEVALALLQERAQRNKGRSGGRTL